MSADDHPRWSGAHYGKTRFHAFNVRRGTDGSGFGNPGLRCTTCHQRDQLACAARAARRAELASGAGRNGVVRQSLGDDLRADQGSGPQWRPSLEEIAVHVRDDELVGWGWEPGPVREPAPGSAEETFQAIEKWSAAGAPCPAK